MSFSPKDRKEGVQVCLNSFSGAAKAVGHDAVAAIGSVAGNAKDAVKNVFHHAKGATRAANSDLKHRMQHKSGRAIDN